MDGFRCIAFRSDSSVDLRAKSGKPLGRYFPEVVALLADLPTPNFVIDGELVIEVEGKLSFDALQMRLHPAESRVRKLSRETPSRFIAFDMLVDTDGMPILDKELAYRRARLEDFRERIEAAGVPHRIAGDKELARGGRLAIPIGWRYRWCGVQADR